jgi:hypothetical protein
LQSPRQLANDRILNAEIIALIRFFLLHGYRNARGLKAIGYRFVCFLGVSWRGPACEPVLQQIEQAVESSVCEFNLRRSRSAIQSQAPALVCGLGADLRPKPRQWKKIMLVL